MQKLLVATTNSAKFEEYRRHLADLALELVSLKDLGLEPVEEVGETFEENALLKARAYAARSKLPTLADDGGLEIEELEGEPGVRSHRWVGNRENADEELIAEVLRRMKGVIPERRGARMRVVIALRLNDTEHIAEGIIEGSIAEQAGPYEAGFPYRALLYVPRFSKLYSELTSEEHAEANQRVKALVMLKPIIRDVLC